MEISGARPRWFCTAYLLHQTLNGKSQFNPAATKAEKGKARKQAGKQYLAGGKPHCHKANLRGSMGDFGSVIILAFLRYFSGYFKIRSFRLKSTSRFSQFRKRTPSKKFPGQVQIEQHLIVEVVNLCTKWSLPRGKYSRLGKQSLAELTCWSVG